MEKHICDYGCGQEGIYQLKCGKWCCSKFVSKCPEMRRKNSSGVKNSFLKGIRKPSSGMLGKIPWNKGKKLEECFSEERVKKIKLKLKNGGLKGASYWKSLSENKKSEFRRHRSEEMKRRYASGWESTAGRCKKYKFESKTGYICLVDGTWELKFANLLDKSNYKWERNIKRFPYINENLKNSTYTPDFYISDLDLYIEIKGYETEKDRCKWRDFPHKLIVLKKEEYKLFDLENLEIILNKGKIFNKD